MPKQTDKQHILKVLGLTFVGNVLSVLLPYLYLGQMEYYRIGFGFEMFNRWSWFMLALAATASNFMYTYVVLVNTKLEAQKVDGETFGYLLMLGMILFFGFYPRPKGLGIESDSACIYVYGGLALVNWVSVANLRKPIETRILRMALSLEGSDHLAAEAKRVEEEHEEWERKVAEMCPNGYVPASKLKEFEKLESQRK